MGVATKVGVVIEWDGDTEREDGFVSKVMSMSDTGAGLLLLFLAVLLKVLFMWRVLGELRSAVLLW